MNVVVVATFLFTLVLRASVKRTAQVRRERERAQSKSDSEESGALCIKNSVLDEISSGAEHYERTPYLAAVMLSDVNDK